jgi:uncharacterized membrane protein
MKTTLWHKHPAVRTGSELTLGERAADTAINAMGSWGFLFCQSLFIAAWMVLNVLAWVNHWDPKPWILLNLIFSIQAAYAAPLVLLASRRSSQRASEEAHHTLQNTELLKELLAQNTQLTQEVHRLICPEGTQ